ncbi:MAG: nitroreductase family protein, partial [Clostridia bacterium]|nr:nitroreductase family protein [Clostridia bacterium]
HMMREATALGLGSIWVMYWESDKMKAEFELTDNIEPVALLIVGYKADTAAPKAGHLKSKTADEILL